MEPSLSPSVSGNSATHHGTWQVLASRGGSAKVFEGFFREALASGGTLIALGSKDGQVGGSARFHGYDERRSEIEIGWTFLARSHWGGLYNWEMKRLMLGHAFKVVSTRYLSCPCRSRNSALAEGDGENRRSSCGIEARCKWARQHGLPNHGCGFLRSLVIALSSG
jgi:RimJ/RimL family protein N-acetyltransferase